MSSTFPKRPSAPLRVAIIGYGLAGSVFHAPLIAATPDMSVTAIVTSSPERMARAHTDFPYAAILPVADELWHDPSRYDLVVVAAPNRVHVPLGLAALQAGLPVVIDKPLAATAADAQRLIDASKEAGLLLTVFQNRRWDNDFLTVRQLLASGTLGICTRFESRYERYRLQPRPGAWREVGGPEEAGGLLYDLGSHLIDQAMVLFGKPLRVYAEMEHRRRVMVAGGFHHPIQTDDDTFVALQFGNGVRAHLWMSLVSRVPGPRFRLMGLHGTYEKWGLDPQEDALRAGKRPIDANWGTEPRERWGHLSSDIGGTHFDGQIETVAGAYQTFYTQLRDALLRGGRPPVDPEDVVHVLRVMEAAQKSARDGQVIEM